jgi:MoaA/NifB/PqqE/SkfB family radical SAM enzyme
MAAPKITSSIDMPIRPGQLDFLWLEITGQCNLTCTHCYADSGPAKPLFGAMHRSDWANVIAEAYDSGCRNLQFIGGEPTLHPDLPSLIGFARTAGYQFIEVFTNATRLSPALIDFFQENRVAVAASFYSHDPKMHDRITGNRGSWGKTVTGLERIMAASLPLRVGIIEMEENAGHLADTLALLQSLGVGSAGSDRLRKIGRGGKNPSPTYTECLDQLCGKCWQGKLCVTPSGEAFPCVFSRASPLGDVRAGLAPILLGERLNGFRSAVYAYRSMDARSDCNPDCTPYCNPNCRPDCMPLCNPNCNPDCQPNCYPNCNPDRRW